MVRGTTTKAQMKAILLQKGMVIDYPVIWRILKTLTEEQETKETITYLVVGNHEKKNLL